MKSGKRDEIVGELILILTRQSLQKLPRKLDFLREKLNLWIFLRELLGDNILNDDDFEHRYFRNANISFTRFIAISTIPTTNDIKKGYEDGIAFNLREVLIS